MLAESVTEAALSAPCLTIVGEMVSLHEELHAGGQSARAIAAPQFA